MGTIDDKVVALPHVVHVLVETDPLYQGHYVALKKSSDNKHEDVICHGTDGTKVLEEAKRLGYEFPHCVYIPKPGDAGIYPSAAH